ncbi:MAG: hypothetical protein Q8T11_14645 [Elusimicrobiota bacterium]|nr:hypothetical protein [Elusimicrobiota bacterium]
MKALLAAVLLAAAPAAAAELDILSVAGHSPTFSTRFTEVFDRVLRDKAAEIEVLGVETVAISHRGHEYELPFSTASGRVPALDNADGVFFLTADEPALTAALLEASRAEPSLPPTYSEHAVLSPGRAVVESDAKVPPAPRATLAVVYRLVFAGRRVDAVFLLRTHGGLGRLATALDALRRPGRARLVVSHGSWVKSHFRSAPRGRALLDALETVGLQAAAVGVAELKRWDEVSAYRRERPNGIRFVSANLRSPDPVEPEALFRLGGATVAVVGLTSPAALLQLGNTAQFTVEDPVSALKSRVAELRPRVDLIVVLSNLDEAGNSRVRAQVRGIDALIASADEYRREDDNERGHTAFEEYRGPFASCLLVSHESDGVERLEFLLGPKDSDGLRRLEIRQTERPLDETVADRPDMPALSAADFAPSTGPVLIPSTQRLFGGERALSARDFWTLNAVALAERTRSEVGILPVSDIGAPTPGDFREGEIRGWFPWDDAMVVLDLEGDDLLDLVRESRNEAWRPTPGRPQLAVGGVGPKETVHGAKIDRGLTYRVVSSRLALNLGDSYKGLARARRVTPRGDLADGIVGALDGLSKRGLPPERYAVMMEGDPLGETPLWIVNFRDISVNYSNTKVVRDDAFQAVPNSRINAFDNYAVGVTVRSDLDYRYKTHKWTNRLDLVYAEQRSRPPDEPSVIDLLSNRWSVQSSLTERLGSFGPQWLSGSAGPNLAVRYDSEVKRRRPGARRRTTLSVLPGVELYDGTVVQSLQLSGNLQRDYSVDPPQSNYGLSSRLQIQHALRLPGGVRAKVIGLLTYDYYFRKRNDLPSDLLHEGNAALKLSFPIFRDFALSPFVDFYFFKLKERPLNGYSAMTGVSLSFSRLWKPQYERL